MLVVTMGQNPRSRYEIRFMGGPTVESITVVTILPDRRWSHTLLYRVHKNCCFCKNHPFQKQVPSVSHR